MIKNIVMRFILVLFLVGLFMSCDKQIEAPKNYREYVAVLSQSGTDSPTSTVLINEFNTQIEWIRTFNGAYAGYSDGLFPEEKTEVIVNNQNCDGFWACNNNVNVISYDSFGNHSDNVLNSTKVEIRIYN